LRESGAELRGVALRQDSFCEPRFIVSPEEGRGAFRQDSFCEPRFTGSLGDGRGALRHDSFCDPRFIVSPADGREGIEPRFTGAPETEPEGCGVDRRHSPPLVVGRGAGATCSFRLLPGLGAEFHGELLPRCVVSGARLPNVRGWELLCAVV
jgi:hypothetical protein